MQPVWRSLIIDDESLARTHLRLLLGAHPEVQILGEATSVHEAAEFCHEFKPNLLFLDIEMPGLAGFDLLPKLPYPLPGIIFVTAHSQFAIRAFEVSAVDYLIKPVYADRLALSLARLQERLPVNNAPRPLHSQDIVLVPIERSFRVVPTRHISCLRADANYSIVSLTTGKDLLVYRTLQQWETCLPPGVFVRLDRSLMIAPGHLQKIQVFSRDIAHLYVRGLGAPLEIGRAALSRLRKVVLPSSHPGWGLPPE